MYTYVLVQCMLNPKYWHIIRGDNEQYQGRLPYEETVAIIKTMDMIRDSETSVLVMAEGDTTGIEHCFDINGNLIPHV